ncbi:hypothetical protein DL95DRAFT_480104 [Leptodontidium sp. 2 PMI_412]|nr:hypothetical protein DL95DRAFT_480104 [Leptodontidium sp. 2 PMI_412]
MLIFDSVCGRKRRFLCEETWHCTLPPKYSIQRPVFEIIIDKQGRNKIPFGFEVEDCNNNGVTTNLRDFSPFLGREWSNPEFQASIENIPYDVAAKDGKVILRVPIHRRDTYLTAEEILSLHLTHLKHIAEVYFNQIVTEAVMSVPFYFNYTQTEAVNRAALSAGLNVQSLVSEFRAVDDAYPTNSIITQHGKGEHNVPDYFLKCSIGDDWLSMSVKNSLRHNHRILGSLGETVSRDDFDFEWSNARILSVLERILKTVQISWENITAIVITGESPHVGNLKLTIESVFSVDKILKSELFGYNQAVVYGVASMAYWISAYQEDECVYLLDTTPLDLGVQVQEDIFVKVISKDIPIPVAKTRVVTATTNDDGNVVINVYQGTSSAASENDFVVRIEFVTLSMGPGVEVEVEAISRWIFTGS